MIYSLRGTLTYEMQGFVVIECGGVGYKCSTSMTTMRALPKIGSEVTLLTYMSVREDAVELFGFATSQELECFKMLIGISGVGSKVGIALLSEFLPEQIAVCIASSDAKTLTKASGVGNKLAQRIILELKDKIKKLGVANSAAEVSKSGSSSVSFGNVSAACEALAVLGYTSDDVLPILSQFGPGLKVEELIHKTLMEIGKK